MEWISPLLDEFDAQPVQAMHPDVARGQEGQILGLKLQLTQAAMCHEYARMEYERTLCVMRRGELLEEMELYHEDYLQARDQLDRSYPDIVTELELEIRSQKQLIFGSYHA